MKINDILKESNHGGIDPRATSQRIRAIQAELKNPLSSDQRGALRTELEKLLADMQTWQSNMPVKGGMTPGAETTSGATLGKNELSGQFDKYKTGSENPFKKPYKQNKPENLPPGVTVKEATLDPIRQRMDAQQAEFDRRYAERRRNIAAKKAEYERQWAEQQAQRAEQDRAEAEQDRLRAEQEAEQKRQKQEAEDRLRKLVQQAIVSNDRSEWNMLSPDDKANALYDAGLIEIGNRFDYSRNAELSNQRLQQAILQNQQQQYEVEIGPEKRAELNAIAEELAEQRRQQLRKEKLEAEKLAYERYKDEAERKDAMKKIEMEYKHDLDMINTEHRNNMEAIRTGNNHEINKLNMEYAEAERDRQHDLEKMRREQEQREKQRQDRPQRPRPEPEPEDTGDEEDEEPGEPFRPQAPAGPALSAPPKPSKYDNDDVTDVEFTEKPRPPKPGKPPELPGPVAEAIRRLKQLAGR